MDAFLKKNLNLLAMTLMVKLFVYISLESVLFIGDQNSQQVFHISLYPMHRYSCEGLTSFKVE